MFKRLFCSHDYMHYHTERVMVMLGLGLARDSKHLFVCKSCGKKSALYEYEVDRKIDRIIEKVKREMALGKVNPIWKEAEFTFLGRKHKGPWAVEIANRYSNYHNETVYVTRRA